MGEKYIVKFKRTSCKNISSENIECKTQKLAESVYDDMVRLKEYAFASIIRVKSYSPYKYDILKHYAR